jgi:hypothetical protein
VKETKGKLVGIALYVEQETSMVRQQGMGESNLLPIGIGYLLGFTMSGKSLEVPIQERQLQS